MTRRPAQLAATRAAIVALLLALAAGAAAQQAPRDPHIGYVYPAGGKQGTTFNVIVGGQFLDGVEQASLSGTGVKISVVEHVKPMTQMQAQRLREELQELLARKSASATQPATRPWKADDEKTVADIREKLAKFVRRPSSPAIAEMVTLQITVDADAPPGPRALRLRARMGLTNPMVFCVGQLPEFSETPVTDISEPTGSVPRNEMQITLPATVNGQIMAGGVDRFRFKARRGQHLIVNVAARELIPYLADAVPGWFQATVALYDAEGNELAYEDDFRFDPDPMIGFLIKKDGEYAVEIKDAIYRGRQDFVYRMEIGELPFITSIFPLGCQAGTQTPVELIGRNLNVTKVVQDFHDKPPGTYPVSVRAGRFTSNRMPFVVESLPETMDKEPNGDAERAQAVTVGQIMNGRIEKPGDTDVFRFEGRAGMETIIEVTARRLNSPLDSIVRLNDSSGQQIALNDDHEDKGSGLVTHHADSLLRLSLPADGTYFLSIGDAQHRGGPEYAYRLRLSPPQPDFALRVVPSSVSVRAGATATLTVYALRKDGFAGPINLSLGEELEGFTLRGAQIPGNQDQVKITVAAPPMARQEPVTLRIDGAADIDGRQVVHAAVPADDMMQAFFYRHLVPAEDLAVTVLPRRGGFGAGERRNAK